MIGDLAPLSHDRERLEVIVPSCGLRDANHVVRGGLIAQTPEREETIARGLGVGDVVGRADRDRRRAGFENRSQTRDEVLQELAARCGSERRLRRLGTI